MSTITRRLMHEGVAAMRDLLEAIAEDAGDPAVATDAASPLAAHLPALYDLATAVEQDDAPALGRLEKEIRSWPFVRATLVVPGEAVGEAEVLYLFRNGTQALLEDGVIISLGLFAPGRSTGAGLQDWEWAEQVEVGDLVVYGADAALGPWARYWVMLGWAADADVDADEGISAMTPLGPDPRRGESLADTLALMLEETTQGRVAWGRRADSAHLVAVLLRPELTGSDDPVAETVPCPDRLTGLVALVQEILFHSPRIPLAIKARVDLAYQQVLDHGAYNALPSLEDMVSPAQRAAGRGHNGRVHGDGPDGS